MQTAWSASCTAIELTIGFGVDLHHLDAEFTTSSLNAHGDFAAIGDKHPANRACWIFHWLILSERR
jgi:hypothetical protein